MVRATFLARRALQECATQRGKRLSAWFGTRAGLLEGASLAQRVAEGARMFYVDYVAGFENYIEKVNHQKKDNPPDSASWLKKDRCLHAARCLMYLRCAPIALHLQPYSPTPRHAL